MTGDHSVIDITRVLSPETAAWPGDTQFSIEWIQETEKEDTVNLSKLTLSPHNSTHIEAPLHFYSQAASVEGLALKRLIGPCLVVDVTRAVDVSKTHLLIDEHILSKAIVYSGCSADNLPCRLLVKTGYKCDSSFNRQFWHFSSAAIDFLSRSGVGLVGTDAPSIDKFASKALPAHKACVQHDIYIIEYLDLTEVESGLYKLIALPVKMARVEASPLRAVLVDGSSKT